MFRKCVLSSYLGNILIWIRSFNLKLGLGLSSLIDCVLIFNQSESLKNIMKFLSIGLDVQILVVQWSILQMLNSIVDVIKLFGGNLDFPKIKILNKVCSNV